MIKAAIIDDELSAANVLRLMLQRHVPEVTQVVVETKPEKAVALLKQYKPDLVFLDVIMPVLTGFDLLNQYEEIPFEIVFTTAFDEFAIQAIRFSANSSNAYVLAEQSVSRAYRAHVLAAQTMPPVRHLCRLRPPQP